MVNFSKIKNKKKKIKRQERKVERSSPQFTRDWTKSTGTAFALRFTSDF